MRRKTSSVQVFVRLCTYFWVGWCVEQLLYRLQSALQSTVQSIFHEKAAVRLLLLVKKSRGWRWGPQDLIVSYLVSMRDTPTQVQ